MQSLSEPSMGQFPGASQPICAVCGSPMYATDKNNFEVTYRCSSTEARFWDFDRGSAEQARAKEHWDKSRKEIFLNRS
jgi:hypothetical protein